MASITHSNLEQVGVISRTIYPEIPPRVEYSLTESGRALKHALSHLSLWAQQYHGVNYPPIELTVQESA